MKSAMYFKNIIYNPTMKFSKYEFNNKLLGGIRVLRVTLCVIWTQTINYVSNEVQLNVKTKKLF